MTKIKSGKRFEQNWKNSVPKNVFYYRFKDGSASWGGNDKVRFQPKNICDHFLFNGRKLYMLELKSTKGKSLPFQNIKEDQINGLLDASMYDNIVCGLVIEFSELIECYFIEINKFKSFCDKTSRKSIPIDYLRDNALKIDVEKKKINSKFDIDKFIKST